MLSKFRILVAALVVASFIDIVLAFITESPWGDAVTTLWLGFGLMWVNGARLVVKNYKDAFRLVAMALFWPLIPRPR